MTCYPALAEVSSSYPHAAFEVHENRCCGGLELQTMKFPNGSLIANPYYAHGDDRNACMELCYDNSKFDLSLSAHTHWCKGFTYDNDRHLCVFQTGLTHRTNSSGSSCAGSTCYVAPAYPFNFTGSGVVESAAKKCDKSAPDNVVQGGVSVETVAAGTTPSPHYPRGGVEECKQICFDASLQNETVVTAIDDWFAYGAPWASIPAYCIGFDWDESTESCRFYSASGGGGSAIQAGNMEDGSSDFSCFRLDGSLFELATNYTDAAFTDGGPSSCCSVAGGGDLSTMAFPEYDEDSSVYQNVSNPFYAHGGDEQACMQLCFENSKFNLALASHEQWCTGFEYDEKNQLCTFKNGVVSSGSCSMPATLAASKHCFITPTYPFTFTGSGFGPQKFAHKCASAGVFSLIPELYDGTVSPLRPRGGINHCKQVCFDNSLANVVIANEVYNRAQPTPKYCIGFHWQLMLHSCTFYSSYSGGGSIRVNVMESGHSNAVGDRRGMTLFHIRQ